MDMPAMTDNASPATAEIAHPVNVGERRSGKHFGNFSQEQAPDPLTARSETHSQNDVHDVHHVHHGADEPANDPLGDATDPAAEAVADAVATCAAAIGASEADPGGLAREEFRAALKFLREDAPDEYFALRGKLKGACKVAGLKLADIESATRPAGEGASDDSTTADELVALVTERAELFHAPDGSCYAALTGDGPRKTYRLDTKAFAEWMGYAYYTDTATEDRPGRAASDTAIRTARTVLTGIATHEGDERPVFLRAALVGGVYYIDLGSEDWSAVEVTPGGWRIVARPPVHFWRPSTMKPLPLPVAGGDLSRLWLYANVPPEPRPLVLAWMLDSWRPETPFAILEMVGQQGSAKSSTQERIRRCIDPNAVDLRAAPKSTEDLFVSAGANWVASLNNLSHLSAAMQDALCNLATGGGFAGRTLFTNADETVVEAKRPVMLNGIVPVVTAQDLTDRVVHIALPELASYRTETVIRAEFERDAPQIVGALLDLFVRTLAALPSVELPKPPRMADYAALGEAMLIGEGQPPGTFLTLYQENRRDSVARSLDASPVASAVRRLADEERSDLIWTGTMGALLTRLGAYRDGATAWPGSARGLGDALRRQRPALAQVGIGVEIGKAGKAGVNVTVRRLPDAPVNMVNVVNVVSATDLHARCETPPEPVNMVNVVNVVSATGFPARCETPPEPVPFEPPADPDAAYWEAVL